MARTAVDPLAARWDHYVQPLYQTIYSGETGLSGVPLYLKEILESGAWKEFITPMGEHVTHRDFETFVAAAPTAGLGANIAVIKDLVRRDRIASDLLDQAVQRPAHIHRDSDNITITSAPNGRGTSSDGALRRLRKDRPDLHARVIDGELSPHAAMIEAGFRTKTITVPLDADRAAGAILRHFSAKDARRVAVLLDVTLRIGEGE